MILRLLALGDILDRTEHLDQRARFVELHFAFTLYEAYPAVRPHYAQLDAFPQLLAAEQPRHVLP